MLTFDEEAETSGGVNAAQAAARLAPLDLAAIGTNHGAGPYAALTALSRMQGAGVPLAAMPNIGLASIVGGRVVYPHSTPEYYGEFAAQAVALGARIVGGCCGTTPAQVEAIRDALQTGRAPIAPFEPAQVELRLVRAGRRSRRRGSRGRSVRGEWVTCVELDPPKGGTLDALVERGAHAARVGARRVRRRQRQPDGAGPDERADGLDPHRARGGDRDDPASHAA